MIKLITICLSFLLGIVSLPSYATKTLNLSPKESKQLSNDSLWTVKATCTVQSDHHSKGKVRISVLKNKGTVNGKSLASGQATSVTINDQSSISVSAEAGTQINLINLGSEKLAAVCST